MSVRCMSLIFMRREESAGKESRTPEVSQGHRDEWFEGADGARLPQDVETVLYRVIQEAVTNTMKHAAAGHVTVAVTIGPGDVTAVVTDDGIGFEMANGGIVPHNSFGLLGMQERLRPVGGMFDVRSTAGRGTTVTVRIPLITSEAE